MVTGDSKKEVLFFRDKQTHRHFIIIYIIIIITIVAIIVVIIAITVIFIIINSTNLKSTKNNDKDSYEDAYSLSKSRDIIILNTVSS